VFFYGRDSYLTNEDGADSCLLFCHFKNSSYLRSRLTIRNREEGRFDNYIVGCGNDDDGSEERTESGQDVSEEWERLG